MFFVLSKLLDVAVDPLWWALLLVVAGALLRRKALRFARGMLIAAPVLLVVFALPAVSNRLWASLEHGAVNSYDAAKPYDVVVLLGGVVSSMGATRETANFNDNIDRLLAVRQLVLEDHAKVVLVSGGWLGGPLRSEAEYDGELLISLGVPADRVVLEKKANNTRENATLSKALIDERGAKSVLLVTSANHMPRAVGCFRAVGIEADALPVDYRMTNLAHDQHWAPRVEYLEQSSRALREWLGRLVYRVVGYTK